MINVEISIPESRDIITLILKGKPGELTNSAIPSILNAIAKQIQEGENVREETRPRQAQDGSNPSGVPVGDSSSPDVRSEEVRKLELVEGS